MSLLPATTKTKLLANMKFVLSSPTIPFNFPMYCSKSCSCSDSEMINYMYLKELKKKKKLKIKHHEKMTI